MNKFITAILEDAWLSDISSILKIAQGGQEEGGGEEGELTASALLNIVTIFPYEDEDEDEDEDERIAVIKVNKDIYSSRTLPRYNDLDDIQRTAEFIVFRYFKIY